MRKINESIENPIDNYLINVADHLSPYFKKINMTPNNITTLSLITGLISAYLIYKEHYISAGIIFFISYFFDCMDGFYARKYKQVSKFGDIYDHVKDVIIFVLTVIIVSTKTEYKKILCLIIGILTFIALIHLGCQERIYQKNESGTLEFTKKLCPQKDFIYITRYFGSGTLITVVSFLIAFCL